MLNVFPFHFTFRAFSRRFCPKGLAILPSDQLFWNSKYVLLSSYPSRLVYWRSSVLWVTILEKELSDNWRDDLLFTLLVVSDWMHSCITHDEPMTCVVLLPGRTCWWTAAGTSAPWMTCRVSRSCGRRRSNAGKGSQPFLTSFTLLSYYNSLAWEPDDTSDISPPLPLRLISGSGQS